MHICHEPDDNRPAQRARVRKELDRLIADLSHDAGPSVILGALADAARRLHRRLEDVDRIPPRKSGRAKFNPLNPSGGPTS